MLLRVAFPKVWKLFQDNSQEYTIVNSARLAMFCQRRITAVEAIAKGPEKKGTTKSTKKSSSFPSCSSWFKAFMVFVTVGSGIATVPVALLRCHSVQGLYGIHIAGIAICPDINLPARWILHNPFTGCQPLPTVLQKPAIWVLYVNPRGTSRRGQSERSAAW